MKTLIISAASRADITSAITEIKTHRAAHSSCSALVAIGSYGFDFKFNKAGTSRVTVREGEQFIFSEDMPDSPVDFEGWLAAQLSFALNRINVQLECLRAELRAECISYGELVCLQDLAGFICESDVELLEAAGVPEFVDDLGASA
jgi:hypothetical protein